MNAYGKLKTFKSADNQSYEDLKSLVKDWSNELHRQRQLVLLAGPMGVGKTQFLRWVFEDFGIPELASPTYAIHHQYKTPRGSVDHVDLYRLEDDGDLESTGFWDLFDRPEGIVFVEWADRLPLEAFPRQWSTWSVELSFGKKPDHRNIKISRRES